MMELMTLRGRVTELMTVRGTVMELAEPSPPICTQLITIRQSTQTGWSLLAQLLVCGIGRRVRLVGLSYDLGSNRGIVCRRCLQLGIFEAVALRALEDCEVLEMVAGTVQLQSTSVT